MVKKGSPAPTMAAAVVGLVVAAVLVDAGPPASGGAPDSPRTGRVSVSTRLVQAHDKSYSPAISAHGECVAFASDADNLVPGDTNGVRDVFVRDRRAKTTRRVSIGDDGAQGTRGTGDGVSISADCRFVAFTSSAPNVVVGDTNRTADVFVRDLTTRTTTRVSVGTGEIESNGESGDPAMSADGRYVAFFSGATNLTAGDDNRLTDVFVHDRQDQVTERVSVATDGTEADGAGTGVGGTNPVMSADGRYVAFTSPSTNLVPEDTNGFEDAFLRDLTMDTTERVSVATDGTQGDSHSGAEAVSAHGRFVVLTSGAENFDGVGDNASGDTFVRDRATRETALVSVALNGGNANQPVGEASVSAHGRYVAFSSVASNLVAGDTNGTWDVFVRDRKSRSTTRTSLSTSGVQGNHKSLRPALSWRARYVAFMSTASNLVSHDTNRRRDVFLTVRRAP